MGEPRQDAVELFVYKKKDVSIVCPQCGLAKNVPLEPLRVKGHWEVKAKCTRCAHVFRVRLNFRKFFRKPVRLEAQLADGAGESLGRAAVVDLSLEGIGFDVQEAVRPLAIGDMVHVSFPAVDGGRIQKAATIVSLRGKRLGAKFVDGAFDPAIYAWIVK
jgi:hypothetical protein